MIQKLTCEAIWHCYREIETGEKLLAELEATREKSEGSRFDVPEIKDAFGRKQGYQFGVPSGTGSFTMYDVAPKLAESVIRAHIAAKRSDLVALNERAKVEIDVL